MNPPYVHACGDPLCKMVDTIKAAVGKTVMAQYHAGVRPDDMPHFWYVHQGWHNKKLHPAVLAALEAGPPRDLHQLALESPHLASDGERLAYIQNDAKGRRDVQTVTTAGKYLTRHFPQFKSDMIRSLAECKIGCRLIKTMPEMLNAMYTGPQSCMKWGKADDRTHPYESYDPKYGWGMAVNEEGTDTVGRALVHFPSMTFVRTYRKTPDGTQACNLMQGWLKNKGFTHAGGWPEGAMIRRIRGAAPYVDGDADRGTSSEYEGCPVWILNGSGDVEFGCQDGSASGEDADRDSREFMGHCVCCSERQYEGDNYSWAGPYEEDRVCENCIDDDYVYVRGRRNCEYWVHEDHVFSIGNEDYDARYLADVEGIVKLHDGTWADIEDCFYCSVSNEYYDPDDDKEVELASGDTAAECNAWQCSRTEKWYSVDDENYLMVNGGDKIHQDAQEDDDVLDSDADDELLRQLAAPVPMHDDHMGPWTGGTNWPTDAPATGARANMIIVDDPHAPVLTREVLDHALAIMSAPSLPTLVQTWDYAQSFAALVST